MGAFPLNPNQRTFSFGEGQKFSELVGQFVVVPEPTDVLNAPATIRARVELNEVEFGQIERSVRVRW